MYIGLYDYVEVYIYTVYMYELVFLEIQTSVCDSIVYWTGRMCNDMCIYRKCIEVDRPCSMCFCYRSCEEGRGETGSQAEGAEAPELVPWETCTVM